MFKRCVSLKSTLEELFKLLKPSLDKLRVWQGKFSEYWKKSDNYDLIGIRTPTGSGKTLIGLLILEQARRNSKRCIYLTHTNQLGERIAEEATKLNIPYFILRGATGVKGDRYRARVQAINDYNDFEHIIISNYASFLITPDFPKKIDFLIIDDVDLFYSYLRSYFTIKIEKTNKDYSSKAYNEIINALSDQSYPIIEKINSNSSNYYDGDIIFPYTYNKIIDVIKKNFNELKKNYNFFFAHSNFFEMIDYYLWFLNNRELTIEPFILPLNQIKIKNSSHGRFDSIEKIILISATLGSEVRVSLELGFGREKSYFITEETFKQDGIEIKMGDRLIFPIVEATLSEVSPFGLDFVHNSLEFIEILAKELKKVLILCWEKREKNLIKSHLNKNLSSFPIYDFTGDNYGIFKTFLKSSSGFLLIANRYFGIDIDSQSCQYCILTRMPYFTSNFDILLDKYLKDEYYYYELQSRKITQSFGRINRSDVDYTAYFILDSRFQKIISDRTAFYPLLPKEIKLRLKHSLKESNTGEIESVILESKRFVKDLDGRREKLNKFIVSSKLEDDTTYEIHEDVLKMTYKDEVKGWNSLYMNKYEEAIKYFANIIDLLSQKSHLQQYRRKIELYQYFMYLIFFKLEKKSKSDYLEKLKDLEEKLSKSEVLLWLNDVVLHATEDIKIQAGEGIITPSLTQKRFVELSKNPQLYLGNLYNLDEINPIQNSIREVLENLAKAQISSPLNSLAIDFEHVCHNALKKRLPEIFISLKDNNDLNVSNVLNALKGNSMVRNSIFHRLHDEKRNLRNIIIHLKEKITEIKYEESIRYCNELKEGIKLLLKDLYFYDMLKNSTELAKKIEKEIKAYKFMKPEKIIDRIIDRWSEEDNIIFDPDFEKYDEITSYHGKIKLESRGKQYEIEISMSL